MCTHMCRLNSPGILFPLASKSTATADSHLSRGIWSTGKRAKPLKATTDNPILDTIYGSFSKFSHLGGGGAEDGIYRFKGPMGRFVEARTWENERTEVCLKAKTLNQMTQLGMPKTSRPAS